MPDRDGDILKMTTALNPPTNQVEIIDLSEYDIVPIATLLAPLIMMGLVSGLTDPSKFTATMEAFNKQAVLTVPVFRGEPGDPGSDSLALKFQNDGKTQPRQLPTDLGDYNSDLGKFWVFPIYDLTTGDAIATTVYVWTGVEGGLLSGHPGLGQGFVQLPIGSPGPDGSYADIRPQLSLTQPNTGMGPFDTDSWIGVNDNSIQVISIDDSVTSGAFKLVARIGGVSATSDAIDYTDVTAGGLESALAAMDNIGSGKIIISGTESPFTVIFDAELNSEGIKPLVVTDSTLEGGTVTIDSGSVESPTMSFNLAVPNGIRGPACALGARYDVDFRTNPPKANDWLRLSTRTTPGPPTGLAASSASTNGSLHAGTYYYVVTATMPNGESVVSNQVSVTVSGSTNRVSLTWSVPAGGGATGFRVYRGTQTGVHNVLVAVISSGTRTSFIDSGTHGTTVATPPTVGMPVGDNIWEPFTPDPSYPLMYTVPQAAFHSAIGIELLSSKITVGAFALPPQPFPWVPVICGELKVAGITLSLLPLQVAAEVTIGNVNGQQVAHGNGNSLGTLVLTGSYGSVEFDPSFSNSYIPVPANHIGAAGTLYVNILNTGLISLDVFNANGAELSVLVIPIEDF